jgi:CO/xanthine dehydrogenase FAD-binding subunit
LTARLPSVTLPADQATGDTSLYYRPSTLHEAVDTLSRHGGQILSGGTDFFPALGERPVSTPVIDISGVGELRGISIEADHIRIGGLTTWTDVLRAQLPRCFDGLKRAAREVGSVQIQNRGTVAGNFCNASPAADGVPPLLVLNAFVELVSHQGTRNLPLSDFILGNRTTARRPDEVLSAVIVPREVDDARSTFLKLGSRRYLVISIVMVAAVVQVDGNGRVAQARVGVGSCSAVARRLPELEKALSGASVVRGISERVLPEHLTNLSPIDDVRATADYRRDAALTLVRRALEQCVEAP